jgi:hypothetical protein
MKNHAVILSLILVLSLLLAGCDKPASAQSKINVMFQPEPTFSSTQITGNGSVQVTIPLVNNDNVSHVVKVIFSHETPTIEVKPIGALTSTQKFARGSLSTYEEYITEIGGNTGITKVFSVTGTPVSGKSEVQTFSISLIDNATNQQISSPKQFDLNLIKQ